MRSTILRRRAVAILVLLAGIPAARVAATGSQSLSNAALDDASDAWARGDYVAALTAYARLLEGPDADTVLPPIALETGELYVTTELTADGAAARISADGRYATYESGTAPLRVTHVVSADDWTHDVAELHGYGAAFSPNGSTLAYVKLDPSPALGAAHQVAAAGSPAQRAIRTAALNRRSGSEAAIALRDLATGRETAVNAGTLLKSDLLFAGGKLLFAGTTPGAGQQVYLASPDGTVEALTSGEGDKTPIIGTADGKAVLISTRPAAARGARRARYALLRLSDRRVVPIDSIDRPSFSADGRWLSFASRDGDRYSIMRAPAEDPSAATIVRSGPERVENTALSADGTRIAYQMMPADDWEIYTANSDGSGERRLTREIQHDLLPQFLDNDRLLAVVGEPRHRRSYLYDLKSGARTRLFHNNTVRTIAPEYSWTPAGGGMKILISAERDGDTVSPARGVYVTDLARTVTKEALLARVSANLRSERALRAKGQRMYAPIAAEVKSVLASASVPRIYGYEKALFDFDSKNISKPGNRLASAYLADMYRSFGYDPELQWFSPPGALGGQTANVVATLKGTVNPELIYVVSSHYDSVADGPGADDDGSGTAALLETARILARHPQPATITFASMTGEEAGLLGSREFVRRAVAGNLHVVGALNNDMIGWANDYRLDNTIRYSNPGIRDAQHAAAIQFTNLITYDSLYYKGTDAGSYYEAYGDIVGGIGSYPVLGNPHYHQPTDLLETIDHQLVAEVAKTTAATIMLLASSPSRLTDLTVDSFNGGTATLSWKPAVEKDVTGYMVSRGAVDGSDTPPVRVSRPSVTLKGVQLGTVVSVKALNSRGLEGWDWASVVVN
jgi:Tol biopolymer transport system component